MDHAHKYGFFFFPLKTSLYTVVSFCTSFWTFPCPLTPLPHLPRSDSVLSCRRAPSSLLHRELSLRCQAGCRPALDNTLAISLFSSSSGLGERSPCCLSFPGWGKESEREKGSHIAATPWPWLPRPMLMNAFVCPFAVFLCCFPAISLLGLFPQINTFCTYLLEQVDMLFFGGSGESLPLLFLFQFGQGLGGPKDRGWGPNWEVCLLYLELQTCFSLNFLGSVESEVASPAKVHRREGFPLI